MARFALGMIETVGLAAAIEAADTAVKSANVKLLGYELTKGNGMVTVKIEGDVGAVNAAIQAGCAAAEKVNRVWSKTIIPRPHNEMHKLIITEETVGSINLEEKDLKDRPVENIKVDEKSSEKSLDITTTINKKEETNEKNKQNEEILEVKEVEKIPKVVGLESIVEVKQSTEIENSDMDKKETKKKDPKKICNLCGDPACFRKKGEPRSLCIHYEEIKK